MSNLSINSFPPTINRGNVVLQRKDSRSIVLEAFRPACFELVLYSVSIWCCNLVMKAFIFIPVRRKSGFYRQCVFLVTCSNQFENKNDRSRVSPVNNHFTSDWELRLPQDRLWRSLQCFYSRSPLLWSTRCLVRQVAGVQNILVLIMVVWLKVTAVLMKLDFLNRGD